MNITYLGHSGFLVETESHLLLFDYYTGTVPPLDTTKTLLVFASHHHPDHMNGSVFSICASHPAVHYILSRDISRALPAHYGIEEPVFVSHNQICTVENCRIHTLRSTDCGVAFLVQCDGKTIYHAGDLNLWLWPGMEKQQSYSMMRRYMEYTAPLREYQIDLAFLTLDNRQGDAAFCNIDYYMRHFSVAAAVPMHYFGSTEIADRFLQDPSSEPYREKIYKMEEGENLTL
ncbi:MAG: MBL fold metallo-hydrolase [Ruminococcaceae bacterium]|nr:MBL fold metallo-hydrolase [Oscillospiraceae bacterium]